MITRLWDVATRWVMITKWQNIRRNEDITKEIGWESSVVDVMKQWKLQLFGHTRQRGYKWLLKTLRCGIVEATRLPGRPPRWWTDDIVEWTGMSLAQAVPLAQDRDSWTTMTSPRSCKTTEPSEEVKISLHCRSKNTTLLTSLLSLFW